MSRTRCLLGMMLGLAAAACGPPGKEGADPSAGPGPQVHGERWSLRQMAQDPADLRPEARILMEVALSEGLDIAAGRIQTYAFTGPPQTIRVWRRKSGETDSCAGKIDVLPMEKYVKGVLPHEWISSWKSESLNAGAIAIRTYASFWVAAGGKYKCADLCDTTASQVYKDTTLPVTDVAVDATSGQVLLKNGSLVFAEYSAENGDPTKSGVSDPVCAGKTLYGHGRGMCQWGSQRWALQGKGYSWIALHYYPGSSLYSSSTTQPDSGPGPKPDSGPFAGADLGSPTLPDAHLGPRPDHLLGPAADRSSSADGGPPLGLRPSTLEGGCAVTGAVSQVSCWPGAVSLILLIVGLLRTARRQGR